MSLLNEYQQAISKGFVADPQQIEVLALLDAIAQQVKHERGILDWFKRPLVKGLYVWGSVGIGKTWLMDVFYNHLPISQKRRIHFHPFMQYIHAELKRWQGSVDPLTKVAKQLAKEVRVLCLDEFLVHDIADAMLLSNLLNALFKQGITLVATSNTPPENLYQHGLQRERFLPAIALLQINTQVFHLSSKNDYRLRHLENHRLYYSPLDNQADEWLTQRLLDLAGDREISTQPIRIAGRDIKVRGITADVAWFDFSALCHVPRSTKDYLELARRYHTLLLSNVPKITAERDDLINYFIHLIDVCYDANVKLIITAEVTIAEIYTEGRMLKDFSRTKSRLQEMQSHAFLSRAHNPPPQIL